MKETVDKFNVLLKQSSTKLINASYRVIHILALYTIDIYQLQLKQGEIN